MYYNYRCTYTGISSNHVCKSVLIRPRLTLLPYHTCPIGESSKTQLMAVEHSTEQTMKCWSTFQGVSISPSILSPFPTGIRFVRVKWAVHNLVRSFYQNQKLFFWPPKFNLSLYSSFLQVTQLTQDRKTLFTAAIYFIIESRLKVYDYSYPILITHLATMARKPSIQSNWESFMQPFVWNVWLYISISILLLPLAIAIVSNRIIIR